MLITFEVLMLSNSNFDWLKMFIRKIEKLKIFFEKLMTSSYYDVIDFWHFCSFSAWILSSNFNGILKTGNYVKANPLSFQKIKTELKNLNWFVFKCIFSGSQFSPKSAAGVIFMMTSSLFGWRHQLENFSGSSYKGTQQLCQVLSS